MINPIKTVIIDEDPQSIELLKLYIKDLDFIEVIGEFNSLQTGGHAILETNPEVVILDISKQDDYTLDLINKVLTQNKECKIIVTSSDYSTNTIIKVMRAGVKEFLPKPIIKRDFMNSLSNLKEQIEGFNKSNKKCRIISTFSNKGGIGKTSIATNLALELANVTKERVALIDLNLRLGDITTFLDLKPSFDISYVIQNLDKLDESFLLSTLEKYQDTNLYVLADPPYMEQTKDITAEQIGILLDKLRQVFSYIVVDTSADFDVKTITALDNSDLILLVSIVNLPAIRNAQRCLDWFERLGYDKGKTKVILNRYMENDEIKIEDVEEVLERKVYWKIPNNYFTIMSAINKGMPVGRINAESNISQSYRELASKLSENIHKQNYSQKVERRQFLNFMNLFK